MRAIGDTGITSSSTNQEKKRDSARKRLSTVFPAFDSIRCDERLDVLTPDGRGR